MAFAWQNKDISMLSCATEVRLRMCGGHSSATHAGQIAAIAMAFEMAVYGAVAGALYRALPKKKWAIYAALLCAMILGRLAWGGVQIVIMGLQNTEFTLSLFLAGAVTGSVPGIILQIVLVPLIVMALQRTKIMQNQ